MQEEFEKKVQERMHTFGMPPSPQVWDDVDAALGKKKHRRVFIGWWILLGLLVAGGGVFLYEKDSLASDKLNQQPAITQDTTQNNLAAPAPVAIPAPVQKESPANTIAKNNTPTQTTASTTVNTKPGNAAQVKNIAQAGRQPYTNTGINGFNKTTPSITGANKDIISQPQDKPVTNQPLAANNQPPVNQNITTPPANNEPPALLPGTTQPATAQATPVSGNEVTHPLAENTSKQPEPPAKVNLKTNAIAKHQWYFTLSGGVTNTNSRSLFKNSADKSYGFAGAGFQNDNIFALTSPAALKYDVALPGTGFNISAGGLYQYRLSRRWQVYGGLAAAYVTNTQKTGLLFNQSFNLIMGFSAQQVQERYYQGGSTSNKIVNKAWQLQVPVGVNFVINPGGKTKWLVNGGVTVATLVSSQWLIPDQRYGRLYYNKEVLNNTILSWQAGPAIELNNKIRFGVNYQQSFTTLAKKYVTPQLHWENLNFYTAIPFPIKTKKAKH